MSGTSATDLLAPSAMTYILESSNRASLTDVFAERPFSFSFSRMLKYIYGEMNNMKKYLLGAPVE